MGCTAVVSLGCLFNGSFFWEKILATRFRQMVLLILFLLGAKALFNAMGF